MEEENKEVIEQDNKEEKLPFDEILKDKAYQSEFDKKIAKALETAKTKWQEDNEAKQNEAQKLAKMKDDEKTKYEKEKVEKELATLKGQLNSKNLKEEATKIASEKGVPIQYLDLVDFSKETAESINSKIDAIETARKTDIEKYLNTKLKEKAPTQKASATSSDPFIDGFNKAWK